MSEKPAGRFGMTVAEYICELQKLPPDLRVFQWLDGDVLPAEGPHQRKLYANPKYPNDWMVHIPGSLLEHPERALEIEAIIL